MAWKHNSVAQIEKLSAQLRNGNRPDAVEKLCLAFEPMVQAFIRRYHQQIIGAEHEELEQVARLGIVEACNTFDRKKGAFQTHAMWNIKRAVSEYVNRLQNPVRLSLRIIDSLPKFRRIFIQLAQKLSHEPTIDELCNAMHMKRSAIEAMLAYDEGPLALDAPKSSGNHGSMHPRDEPWVESYPSPELNPEEALIAKEEYEEMRRLQGSNK